MGKKQQNQIEESLQKQQLFSRGRNIKHTDKQKPLKKRKLPVKWDLPSIKGYLVYLIAFKQKFEKGPLNKLIYEQITEYVGNNKTMDQCYNFHIRMRQTHKNYDKIIQVLKKKFTEQVGQLYEIEREAKKAREDFQRLFKEKFDLKIKLVDQVWCKQQTIKYMQRGLNLAVNDQSELTQNKKQLNQQKRSSSSNLIIRI